MSKKYRPILAKALQKISIFTTFCKKAFHKSPYLVLTFIFITWVLFFDSADLATQYKLTKRINKLFEEQTFYQKQIAIMQQEQEALIADKTLLEKFAREKYFMKKPTEDIYIVLKP